MLYYQAEQSANFKNGVLGVLEVKIPRPADHKPKQIEIK